MPKIEWHDADVNENGIETIAFQDLGEITPNAGKIVGYNGILKGDEVKYGYKTYKIVMVSRLGDFGISLDGKLPYINRVSPISVTLLKKGNLHPKSTL
ncbi:hypothetical protein R3O67_29465 [Bacillus cereus]|uniref:hypothetical protein n=1 Tax=Bacillus cereus TaxID=1396 RepID=UPI00307A5EC2